MSTASRVRKKVKRLKRGEPFTAAAFSEFGAAPAVHKALSRMVKEGAVTRAAHGVYVKPEPNRFFGATPPSVRKVAERVAKNTGEKLGVHGAEAVRHFGLTTQTPVTPVFHTSGHTRARELAGTKVRFEHLNPKYMRHAGTQVGSAIAALLYLGQEKVNPRVLRKVYGQLAPAEQTTLLEELTELPSWLQQRVADNLA